MFSKVVMALKKLTFNGARGLLLELVFLGLGNGTERVLPSVLDVKLVTVAFLLDDLFNLSSDIQNL
jgi:hypothetical protein